MGPQAHFANRSKCGAARIANSLLFEPDRSRSACRTPMRGMHRIVSRPSPGPDMQRLAEQFVESMRLLGWELDYSEGSLQTVEEMIDGQFADWRPWRRGKAAK